MAIVPIAAALVEEGSVLTLPRYARLIGYSECSFFGITGPRVIAGWQRPRSLRVIAHIRWDETPRQTGHTAELGGAVTLSTTRHPQNIFDSVQHIFHSAAIITGPTEHRNTIRVPLPERNRRPASLSILAVRQTQQI